MYESVLGTVPFPTWRHGNSFSCRRYPARPLRDSQIIKIVGLPMSWFGLRLLNVPKGTLGFSDAIDVGELPVAGSFLLNILGRFVFVTVLMHVSQVGLPVLAS